MAGSDHFEEFLALCQESLGNSKKELVKLVKKRYRELDEDYVDSEDFSDLLGRTRQSIVVDKKRLFVHLKVFLDALKCHKSPTKNKKHRHDNDNVESHSKRAKLYHSDDCSGVDSSETDRGKLFYDSELASSVSGSDNESEIKPVVENGPNETIQEIQDNLNSRNGPNETIKEIQGDFNSEPGISETVKIDPIPGIESDKEILDETVEHDKDGSYNNGEAEDKDAEQNDYDSSGSDLPAFDCTRAIEIIDSQKSEEHIECKPSKTCEKDTSSSLEEDIFAATSVTGDQLNTETEDKDLQLGESVEAEAEAENISIENDLEDKVEPMEDDDIVHSDLNDDDLETEIVKDRDHDLETVTDVKKIESPTDEVLDTEDSDCYMSEGVLSSVSEKSKTSASLSKKRKHDEVSSSSNENSSDSEENRRIREKCRRKGVISVGKKNKVSKTSSLSESPSRSGHISRTDNHVYTGHKSPKKFGNSPKKKSRKKNSPVRGSPKKIDIVIITDSESSSECDLSIEKFDQKVDEKYEKKHTVLKEKKAALGKIKKHKRKECDRLKLKIKKLDDNDWKLKTSTDSDQLEPITVNTAKTSKKRVALIPVPSPEQSKTRTKVDIGSGSEDDDQKGKLNSEVSRTGADQLKPEKAGPSHGAGDAHPNPNNPADQAKIKASAKQIKRLEKLLQQIRNKIEEVQNRELGLEELDSEVSDYLLEDKLKHKLMRVWDKLCELHKASKITGRHTEKYFRYQGTRYPVINRKIEKLINKNKIFPDYHDIRGIIFKVNKDRRLHLRVRDIDDMARDAFTEVGNQLQERRMKDLVSTLKTDGVSLSNSYDDPALYDPELKKKLESNRKTGKTKMDQVMEKYKNLQMEHGDKTDDDEDEEEEAEEEETEKEKENTLEIDAIMARSMVASSDEEKDQHDSPCLEIENFESGAHTTLDLHRPGDVDKLKKFKGAASDAGEMSDETSFAAMLGLKSVGKKKEVVKEEVKTDVRPDITTKIVEDEPEIMIIEIEETKTNKDNNHPNRNIISSFIGTNSKEPEPLSKALEDKIKPHHDVVPNVVSKIVEDEPEVIIIETEETIKTQDNNHLNRNIVSSFVSTNSKEIKSEPLSKAIEETLKPGDSYHLNKTASVKASSETDNQVKYRQPCFVIDDEDDIIFMGDSNIVDSGKEMCKVDSNVVKQEMSESKINKHVAANSSKSITLKNDEVKEMDTFVIDLINETSMKETGNGFRETTATKPKPAAKMHDNVPARSNSVECVELLSNEVFKNDNKKKIVTEPKAATKIHNNVIARSNSVECVEILGDEVNTSSLKSSTQKQETASTYSTQKRETASSSSVTGCKPDCAIASGSMKMIETEDSESIEEGDGVSDSEESEILIPLITRTDPTSNSEVSELSEVDDFDIDAASSLEETITAAEKELEVFGPSNVSVHELTEENNKSPSILNDNTCDTKDAEDKSIEQTDRNGAKSWFELKIKDGSDNKTENELDRTLAPENSELEYMFENDDDDDDDLHTVTETELEGSLVGSSVSDIFRGDTPVDEDEILADSETQDKHDTQGNSAVSESAKGTIVAEITPETINTTDTNRDPDTIERAECEKVANSEKQQTEEIPAVSEPVKGTNGTEILPKAKSVNDEEPNIIETAKCDVDITIVNNGTDDELEITSVVSSSQIAIVTEKLKLPEVKNNLIKLEKATNKRTRIYPLLKQKPKTEPLWLEEDEHADLIENYVEPDSSVFAQDEIVVTSTSLHRDVIILSDSE